MFLSKMLKWPGHPQLNISSLDQSFYVKVLQSWASTKQVKADNLLC